MLADVILKIAGMEGEEEQHEYYPRPSISGPGRCIRQMVYWGMGLKRQPLPGRTMLIFNDSSWHEELTMDWLRKSAFQVHSPQMKVSIDSPGIPINLEGSIDFIVTDITGKDYLIEHKAINHFTFQGFWDGELPMDYLTQTCIYMRGLQKVNPVLTSALLLIKNKNTAAYIEYALGYESAYDRCEVFSLTDSNGKVKDLNKSVENITLDAFTKFMVVADYISKKTLPKRQYFVDDWQCSYCGWAGTCWDGYQKEFTELKTGELLPNEVADLIRYYKEIGAQKGDIEKEYTELSDKIKATMKEAGTREGIAGEYIAKLALIETTRLDKELLTDAEKEKASKKSFYERLSISQVKAKKEKKP
jgi:hypothetical protein